MLFGAIAPLAAEWMGVGVVGWGVDGLVVVVEWRGGREAGRQPSTVVVVVVRESDELAVC
jgi:hypothetical protein